METKPKLVKKQTEKVISQPPQPQRDVFAGLIDKRITIQEKGGAVVTGTLISYKAGLLHLQSAEVSGRNHTLALDWIYIDRTAIAHFHHAVDLGTPRASLSPPQTETIENPITL